MRLVRLAEANGVTQGMLFIDGVARICTIEPPWKHNLRDISCIPAGSYTLQKYYSSKHGNTWRIDGVEGRDPILIHKGNQIHQTKGCILVGMNFHDFDGMPGVGDSTGAFHYLQQLLGDRQFVPLIIQNLKVEGQHELEDTGRNTDIRAQSQD